MTLRIHSLRNSFCSPLGSVQEITVAPYLRMSTFAPEECLMTIRSSVFSIAIFLLDDGRLEVFVDICSLK